MNINKIKFALSIASISLILCSCNSQVETETYNSTYQVVSEPKCETAGLGRYTITFE